MERLAQKFQEAMFNIYRRAKTEANYRASIFLDMISTKGGLPTAKYLINAPKVSDGYTHLYERGRLDLTVEAPIVEETKWQSLFTSEEIEKARRRLIDYQYVFKNART